MIPQRLRIMLMILALTLQGLSGNPSEAAPINVINAGFEDISGETPFNEFTFGPLNGWDLYDPIGVTDGGDGPTYYVGTLTPFEPDPVGNPGVFANFTNGAAEGQRVGIAFNFANSGNQAEYGLVQTLTDTLQADTTYTLEVEIGNIASGTAMSGDFFDLDGFPGYRVDLLAGNVIVAQDNNALAGSINEGEFATSSITFETGAAHPQLGATLGIRLVNLNLVDAAFPESDLEVDFDDVRLDATPTEFPSGDFNQDGVWDCIDVDALVAAIVAGSTDLTFDMNGDGLLTPADITDPDNGWLVVGGGNNPTATAGNPFLVGDANLDGVVDGQDFITWNTHKFASIAAWCAGDFTTDGIVDGQDFVMWNNHKFTGAAAPTEMVPEGTSPISLVIASLMLWHSWFHSRDSSTATNSMFSEPGNVD